jgi:hypothetical protein
MFSLSLVGWDPVATDVEKVGSPHTAARWVVPIFLQWWFCNHSSPSCEGKYSTQSGFLTCRRSDSCSLGFTTEHVSFSQGCCGESAPPTCSLLPVGEAAAPLVFSDTKLTVDALALQVSALSLGECSSGQGEGMGLRLIQRPLLLSSENLNSQRSQATRELSWHKFLVKMVSVFLLVEWLKW